MTVVNPRYTSLLIATMFAACARSAAPPVTPAPPAPSRAALDAKPVAWSVRDPKAVLVPETVRRLQLVILPGWAPGERYAFLVSSGTDVIAVYKTTGAEVGDVIAKVANNVYTVAGTPVDKLAFGVLGSVHAPPPPPPGPGGIPEFYVRQALNAAWRLNGQQEAEATAAAE